MTTAAAVGLGNRDRGDDGVGLLVAERLGDHGLTVVPVAGPLDLLDVFGAYDTVVVVDAVRSGAAPGTVSVTRGSPPARTGSSTHGFGLAEAVALARALDRLPSRLLLVGVELAGVTTGTAISKAVAAAVDAAAAEVLRELAVPEGA